VVLALAVRGASVVIAAKTTEPQPTLPGTIFTVAQEARDAGGKALAVKTDLRDVESIRNCVEQTMKTFGRIDFLINNASALWWQNIADTPVKRYDLITQINARGTFIMTKLCLPHMEKNGYGRIVTMSPPISNLASAFAGRTAYNISKFGMTMVALGVAAEFAGKNITAHSLWPATIIESLASINFALGDRDAWRKATILSDATLAILSEGEDFNGQQLIDDTYLRSKGLNDEDFKVYRCNPDVEPPRLLALAEEGGSGYMVKRGSVARLEQDMKRSDLKQSKL